MQVLWQVIIFNFQWKNEETRQKGIYIIWLFVLDIDQINERGSICKLKFYLLDCSLCATHLIQMGIRNEQNLRQEFQNGSATCQLAFRSQRGPACISLMKR